MNNTIHRDDAPQATAALVGDIIRDAQKLIRREIDLAKAELKDEGRKAKITLVVFGSAIGLALIGFFSLSLSLVFYLSNELSVPLWLGFLATTFIFAVLALALGFWANTRIMRIEVIPPRTAESIRENVQWIRSRN